MDGIPTASAEGHSSKPPSLRNLWRMDKVDSHLSANPSKEVCSTGASWSSWLSSSTGTTAIAKDFECKRVPTENCCSQHWWWFSGCGQSRACHCQPLQLVNCKIEKQNKATNQLHTQVALTSRTPHHHCRTQSWTCVGIDFMNYWFPNHFRKWLNQISFRTSSCGTLP